MKRLLLVLALLCVPFPAFAQLIQPSPQGVSVQDSGTTCSVANTCASWTLPGNAPSVTIAITGTFSATLTFEGTASGQSWFSLLAVKLSDGSASSTTTTTGQFAIVNSGLQAVRVRAGTLASGGANITLTRGQATSVRLFNLSSVTGTLAAANGGTGTSSYTIGDLLAADSTTTLAKVACAGSNKVLQSGSPPTCTGNPVLQAGTGTGSGSPPLQIHYQYINTANAGDNLYVASAVFTMPANTLATNGDGLILELVTLESSEGTDSRTYECTLGGTMLNTTTGAWTGGTVILTHATTVASVTIHAVVHVTRLTSGTGAYWDESSVGGSFQVHAWTGFSPDFTGALTIQCAAANTNMTPAAAAITLEELRVTYIPVGAN